MIFNFHLSKREPLNLGGVQALPQGDGLVKNGVESVFLGPYGIPHVYKCQASGEKIPQLFIFINRDSKFLFNPSLSVKYTWLSINYICLSIKFGATKKWPLYKHRMSQDASGKSHGVVQGHFVSLRMSSTVLF